VRPGSGANSPNRTPLAEKWFTRASASYHNGDFDDASQAARSAFDASPSDPEIRLLSARLALASLDYGKAAKLTEGMDSAEALALRGRAHWYAGDVEAAADALETLLRDPAVKDPWARQIATLARSGGTSRKPFTVDGGLVAAVEMPEAGPAMVVPCELNGEHILALVATATSEVVIDSNSRKEPAWVTLRFGERLEVSDVPAITQDLARSRANSAARSKRSSA
jgi:tetratricopeptide (TPR) repeat protein